MSPMTKKLLIAAAGIGVGYVVYKKVMGPGSSAPKIEAAPLPKQAAPIPPAVIQSLTEKLIAQQQAGQFKVTFAGVQEALGVREALGLREALGVTEALGSLGGSIFR